MLSDFVQRHTLRNHIRKEGNRTARTQPRHALPPLQIRKATEWWEEYAPFKERKVTRMLLQRLVPHLFL